MPKGPMKARTAQPGALDVDRRSPLARAVDDVASWLAGRLPDRAPSGAGQYGASRTWCAELTDELRARVLAEHRGEPDTPELDQRLRDLSAALREGSSGSEIAAQRRAVECLLDSIENPPPPPAITPVLVELARDLGINAPNDLAEARRVVGAALRDADVGDKRAAPLWARYLPCALMSDADTGEARRFRYALAGFGLPPVRADDAVYGSATISVICPELPPVAPHHWGEAGAPLWLEGLLVEFRLPRPRLLSDAAARSEHAKRLDHLRHTLDGQALQEAWHELDRWLSNERAALVNRLVADVEELRRRLVAAVDAELTRRVVEGPLGALAYFWLREFRRHLALNPGDRPTMPGTVMAAWVHCRTLGVRLSISA
jgi:hypothetical protein